jgi:hypothetical protein
VNTTEINAFWGRKTTVLPIRLGSIHLLSFSFESLVYTPHFSAVLTTPAIPDTQVEEVDLFYLPSLPSNKAPDVAQSKFLALRSQNFPRHMTSLSGTFDGYMAGFSSKSRGTLTRKVRKFEEAAGADYFSEWKGRASVRDFFAIAAPVSENTYQERLLNAGLPTNEEFIRQAEQLADEDRFRGYTLKFQGKPVAYLFSRIKDGIVFYDYLGHLPEYSNLSPGSVLQYLAFRNLFAEQRFTFFDFGKGEGQHKRQFGNVESECVDIYFFKPTLKARIYLALRSFTESLTKTGLSLLDATGMRTFVRRYLRS